MNKAQALLKKLIGIKNWFFSLSLTKKVIVTVLLLVVLFIITSPLRKKPAQYQTATVTRQTIEETVSESGNIASNGQSGISSPSTGVITELDVANGDKVTAEQTLFKVKATATPQDQATAYTNYENAVSALQTAKNNTQSLDATMWTKQQAYLTAQDNENYKNNNTVNPSTKNNYTDLEKQQIDSAVVQTQKDFEAAEQAYTTSNVAVTAAQASVNSTGLAYQATKDVTVTAPIAGIIENLAFGVGDKVTAGISQTAASATTTTSSVTSTPVLYIITDGSSNSSLAVVQVNEVDFPKIKQGQTADITLPALPNKTFSGRVVKIDKLGTNTSSVISFNVYIALNNPDTNIAPNMTVDVDINTAKHENALTVPNSAIKPYKGGKAVEVLDKSKPAANQMKFVPVTIGIKSIDRTEILKGVGQGTIVITSTDTVTKPAGGPFGG